MYESRVASALLIILRKSSGENDAIGGCSPSNMSTEGMVNADVIIATRPASTTDKLATFLGALASGFGSWALLVILSSRTFFHFSDRRNNFVVIVHRLHNTTRCLACASLEEKLMYLEQLNHHLGVICSKIIDLV